ncbi:helix-turn-helix domain-containing protein [Pseudoalteromonas luteoviolacea]|uniref:helix-turn-helix domain-containing protein n=1 Tax=Pseudoalteromonas luteoviolacea TaxID=43657 RepID=UPI00163BF890|nr:helix-turn-helix transcriptional regulator [Pseudoalteromonas luteoviolacea]
MKNESPQRIYGDELKALRLTAGLSVEQLAKKFGVTPKSVQNYENDVSKIPTEHFLTLLQLSNLNLNPIFSHIRRLKAAIDYASVQRVSKRKKKIAHE